MLSFSYAECRKEAHYAECHYAECQYAKCHYAECHYAKCRYAECRGAQATANLSKFCCHENFELVLTNAFMQIC